MPSFLEPYIVPPQLLAVVSVQAPTIMFRRSEPIFLATPERPSCIWETSEENRRQHDRAAVVGAGAPHRQRNVFWLHMKAIYSPKTTACTI